MSAVKNEEIMFFIVFFGSGETGMNRVSSHHNHKNRTDGSRLPDFCMSTVIKAAAGRSFWASAFIANNQESEKS